MPSIFISHGGGPSFFMKGGMMKDIDADSKTAVFLKSLPSLLPSRPKAVLVLSAHWEEERTVKVYAGKAHPMLFDYYGFPKETYDLKFPARGSPEVAARVISLLTAAGIPCEPELARGFDHGVFVPLLVA